MAMEIPLRAQKEIVGYAKVSQEDFEWASKFKWRVHTSGFPIATMGVLVDGDKKYKECRMHIEIWKRMGNSGDQSITHVNGDKFDNRRDNLKLTTIQNIAQKGEKGKKEDATSKYVGVDFKDNKYRVQCANQSLGYYEDEIEAAKAYDRYALLKYGKDAKTNGLVKFSDVENMNIEDFMPKKEEKTLPKYISTHNKKYCVDIEYHDKRFKSYHGSLEEAEKKLEEYKEEIQKLEREYRQRPIVRNTQGQAIIQSIDHKEIIVDDDVWHELSLIKWKENAAGYMQGKVGNIQKYIMKVEGRKNVTHKNGNKLDNRRDNLKV